MAKLGVEQRIHRRIGLGGNDFGALEQIAINRASEIDSSPFITP
jgi:hypothetical protein